MDFDKDIKSENRLSDITRLIGGSGIIDEDIIGLEGRDIVDRIELTEKYEKIKKSRSNSFYSDLIYTLMNIRLTEKIAKEDWKNILQHKEIIGEKLGRNVGIRVATLDFYTNINKQILSPKIIDMQEYTKVVKESITDPLTFCYNRRYFDYIVKHYFSMAKESNSKLSLCMIDVDDFKIFNDSNGHIAGDFALIEISRILNVVTRKSDIVARYGGEEFSIIFMNTGIEEAFSFTQNIREAVENFRFPNEHQMPGKRLTISVGVTTVSLKDTEPNDLIKRADTALYKAKSSGKNIVVRG